MRRYELTLMERLRGTLRVEHPRLPWQACNERLCWNPVSRSGKCELCWDRIHMDVKLTADGWNDPPPTAVQMKTLLRENEELRDRLAAVDA
jgi:hypothetical protein